MWESLLEDVASHSSNQKLKSKNLLLLGDEGCGKNTVVAGLQGRKTVQDDRAFGTGMEYMFLDVRDKDESDDVIERMGCYILNGTTDSAYLLQLVLTPELIGDAILVMVVDLARPWLIMDSLEKWSNEINTHLESFSGDDKMQRLREERVKHYQTFTEESGDAKKEGEEQVALDLDEGVLETNFGIPFIVVATKSDCLEQLSQDFDYHQEHLDFVQLHMRRFCLKHGATLVYVGKGGKNKDTLYRTVVNAAYGMDLSYKANVSENDSIFVPSGWDNPTKINVLTESFQNIKAQDTYADTIKNMSAENNNTIAKEVVAEDEQEFLKKQQQLLGSSTSSKHAPSTRTPSQPTERTSSTSTTSSASTTDAEQSEKTPRTTPLTRDRERTSRSTSGSVKSPRRPPAPGTEGQDVLKDFFNSLLERREGDKKGVAPAKKAPDPQ
eukprot:m.258585 g.258585  ORF g.258585 m.258585 type:complete len:439 (-) comp36774_c0_seq1:311-1627(-)